MYENIRSQLYISQQEMADYLGISRTLLAAFETGRRTLPTAVSLKLNLLELVYVQQQKKGKLPDL